MQYSAKSRAKEQIRLLTIEDQLDASLQAVVKKVNASDPYHILLDLREAGEILAEHGRPLLQANKFLLSQTRSLGILRHEHDAAVLIGLMGLEREVPCYYELKEGIEGLSRRSIGRTVGDSGKHAVGALPSGEEGVKAFCQVVARSMFHIALLDYLVGDGNGQLQVSKKVAKAVHTDAETLGRLIADFQGVNILRPLTGNSFGLDTSGAAGKLIPELLKMWRHTSNRKKVMAWVKPLQQADQQKHSTSTSGRKKGLLGKLFG